MMRTFTLFALLLLPVAITGQGKPLFNIVHLGDSYSSGNGARNNNGRQNFVPVRRCVRRSGNWGQIFANSLSDVFSVHYNNRACSGAILAHIVNNVTSGADGMPTCFPSSSPGVETIERDGMCLQVLSPQIEAVDSTTDLVIMTIGGNDAGFPDIALSCLDFRRPNPCEMAIARANRVLDNFAPQLASVLGSIRSRMKPEGRVVLVTYPHLVISTSCPLNRSATRFDPCAAIRALGNRADEVQRDAASRAGVILFDRSKDVFRGRERDPRRGGNNDNSWIHGLVLPLSASYHPNVQGHLNWGRAISALGTFGAIGGSFETGGSVDLVFVVDTTGSMAGVIEQVRINLQTLVSELSEATASFRVAIVAYRDFPERTGSVNDFPSEVVLTFTNSLSSIQDAIDSLEASSGGDSPETVLSGINAANGLPWRLGVTKTALVIGDAPPLLEGGAEPISGLTPAKIIADSIAIDPVRVIGLDVGGLVSPDLLAIINGTGGALIEGGTNLTSTLLDIIDGTAALPVATFGQAVEGRVGEPVLFDTQGSFDPRGRPIDLYEWDFDGDGVFDLNTTEPLIEHTYFSNFSGFVVLRVTSDGVSSLASAPTEINEDGSFLESDQAPCEIDENGLPVLLTDDGIFNTSCTPTNLPPGGILGFEDTTADTGDGDFDTEDMKDGESSPEASEEGGLNSGDMEGDNLMTALDVLDSSVSDSNPTFRALSKAIRLTALDGQKSKACRLLTVLRTLAKKKLSLSYGKIPCYVGLCIKRAKFDEINTAVTLVVAALDCRG